MTIEAVLTRELEITFIHARKLVTEAKLELGVKGYPNEKQEEELIIRSKNMFEALSEKDRIMMRRIKIGLDSVKIESGSLSSHASVSAEVAHHNVDGMKRIITGHNNCNNDDEGLSQCSTTTSHQRRT